jgi:hypothetical protein
MLEQQTSELNSIWYYLRLKAGWFTPMPLAAVRCGAELSSWFEVINGSSKAASNFVPLSAQEHHHTRPRCVVLTVSTGRNTMAARSRTRSFAAISPCPDRLEHSESLFAEQILQVIAAITPLQGSMVTQCSSSLWYEGTSVSAEWFQPCRGFPLISSAGCALANVILRQPHVIN